MKKRRKTILLAFLVVILTGFNFLVYTHGQGGAPEQNGQEQPGGTHGSSSGNWAFSQKSIGYRMSYVDQDGNKIGHAFDVILAPDLSFDQIWNKPLYTMNGTMEKKIRQEYSDGSAVELRENSEGITGRQWASLVTHNGEGAIALEGELGPLMAQSLSSRSFGGGAGDFFHGVHDYLVRHYNAGDFEVVFNQLVSSLFGATETYANLSQPSTKNPGMTLATERFIQFEPLYIVTETYCNEARDHGSCPHGNWDYSKFKGIYGTATEVIYAIKAWEVLDQAGYVSPEINKRAPKPWCTGEGINCVVQTIYTGVGSEADQRRMVQDISTATMVEFIYMGDIIQQPTYTCEQIAVALKNQVKPTNLALYESLVEKLRNASELAPFQYDLDMNNDGTKETVSITTPQNFDLLIKSNYIDDDKNPYRDKSAHCETPLTTPGNCSGTYSGTADVDNCTTGKTYYSDYPTERVWLECEIAFSNGGNHTSDNTNHVTISADTVTDLTMADGTVVTGNTVGNDKYCKLFCTETFETRFPTSVYGIKAGQVFAWGSKSGKFGSIHVEKLCKNQQLDEANERGYLYNKWKRDYVANEKALVDAYLKYAANQAYLDEVGDYTGVHVSGCTTNRYPDGRYKSTTCTAIGKEIKREYTHSYIGHRSYTTPDNETSKTRTSRSEARSAAQQAVYQEYLEARNEAQNEWAARKQDEPAYLLYIRQCTKNLKYVYETVVNLIFDEPVNNAYGPNTRSFSSRDELDLDPLDSNHEQGYNTSNFVLSESGCHERDAYIYNCTYDHSCTAVLQKVKECSQAVWRIKGDWTYSYPSGIFKWYSYKVDGSVVNETGHGMNTNGKNQLSASDAYFYSIGYSLPTALSLTNGQYEMSVAVSDLGDKAESNQTYNVANGHFADLTGTNILGKSGFDYTCTYEVENEIFGYDCQYGGSALLGESPEFCDPSNDPDPDGYLNGVDVTYRVIQLLDASDDIDKAFPGQDGTGRRRGKNWNILSDETVHEILDANSDTFQPNKAMYEIMLDINGIQWIRNDNRRYFNSGSSNPYTSYTDYNGMDKIICVGSSDKNKYCASTFLDDLQNLNGGVLTSDYILRGTCLPTGLHAEARANEILAHGCGNSYTYPIINWAR